MVYHGKGGYTPEEVGRMSLNEVVWHATRLKEQLDAEKKAQDEALQKARSRARAASAKRAPRRR